MKIGDAVEWVSGPRLGETGTVEDLSLRTTPVCIRLDDRPVARSAQIGY